MYIAVGDQGEPEIDIRFFHAFDTPNLFKENKLSV